MLQQQHRVVVLINNNIGSSSVARLSTSKQDDRIIECSIASCYPFNLILTPWLTSVDSTKWNPLTPQRKSSCYLNLYPFVIFNPVFRVVILSRPPLSSSEETATSASQETLQDYISYILPHLHLQVSNL